MYTVVYTSHALVLGTSMKYHMQLMNAIGNERSNSFWERHLQEEKLPADVERDIREGFIRAKYEVKSWIPTPTGESRETLSKLLCVAVKTDNLLRTVELLTRGADVSIWLSSSVCVCVCEYIVHKLEGEIGGRRQDRVRERERRRERERERERERDPCICFVFFF